MMRRLTSELFIFHFARKPFDIGRRRENGFIRGTPAQWPSKVPSKALYPRPCDRNSREWRSACAKRRK